jgi:hypothetical protein
MMPALRRTNTMHVVANFISLVHPKKRNYAGVEAEDRRFFNKINCDTWSPTPSVLIL